MKNLFLPLLGIAFFFSWGCVKHNQVEIPNANSNSVFPVEDRWTIYSACWEEWGRASNNCNGWGLCNFEDCWGWQTPCCGSSSLVHTGTIAYDVTTDMYMMTIMLNNTNTQEASAISAQTPLYIDEDIIDYDPADQTWNSIKIEAGAYPFLPGIGNYGGYKIPVIFN